MSKKNEEGMTGSCKYCGQQLITTATDQLEADIEATKMCRCAAGEKGRADMQCKDNITQICGPAAEEYGMIPLDDDLIDTLYRLGTLCIYKNIDAASVRCQDSTVTIKKTKDGTSVARKKVSTLKLDA